MDADDRARLAQVFVTLAIANVVVGAGACFFGLFGVFWATLGRAAQGWQDAHVYGFQLPQEVIASPAYFWFSVCVFSLGVGLVIGASVLLHRQSWGRLLNLFVCAFGIGLFAVSLLAGLARGRSAFVTVLVGLFYLVLLGAFMWHPQVREFWHGPPVAGESVEEELDGHSP